MQIQDQHHTAVVRVGRSARIEIRRAAVGRRRGEFIQDPDCSNRQWVIVKTNPQCEMRAVEALLSIGIHAYAPCYRRRLFDTRSQRRISRTTPFLTGYVFAMISPDQPDFGMLRDSDGVAGTLPMDMDQPRITIHDREIEVLRRLEASYWLSQDKAFRARGRRWLRGKNVKAVAEPHILTTGAFEGFLAAILKLEGDASARVVTQVFGKMETTVVSLDDLLAVA